jgi:hypothetical protein
MYWFGIVDPFVRTVSWSVIEGVMLNAASRGQEFVLDCDPYPEAINWLAELLTLATP